MMKSCPTCHIPMTTQSFMDLSKCEGLLWYRIVQCRCCGLILDKPVPLEAPWENVRSTFLKQPVTA